MGLDSLFPQIAVSVLIRNTTTYNIRHFYWERNEREWKYVSYWDGNRNKSRNNRESE